MPDHLGIMRITIRIVRNITPIVRNITPIVRNKMGILRLTDTPKEEVYIRTGSLYLYVDFGGIL